MNMEMRLVTYKAWIRERKERLNFKRKKRQSGNMMQ